MMTSEKKNLPQKTLRMHENVFLTSPEHWNKKSFLIAMQTRYAGTNFHATNVL
jgi:hypothetical protein